MGLKIVIISDVHCKFNKLKIPECDILISCGDYSFLGQPHEVKNFHKWFSKQNAKHKISVQGNHEKGVESAFSFSKQIAEEYCPDIIFIDEGLVEIEGLKIWCSAITPFFFNWAWNRYRGEEIKKHWDRIPIDTDILVTHGPPYGILDTVKTHDPIMNLGCEELTNKIKELEQLKIHCFGHIHDGYGVFDNGTVKFVNASICNEQYKPVNLPIVIDL
jgi:Icc-related predicted phosphoesterase